MQALRYQHLVYIPITKHASTTYQEFFRNRLGWQSITVRDINWGKDHVFAHIINPLDRHIKGTAEFLWQHYLEDLIDDPKFCKLLSTAVFDLHSYPLVALFGIERMYQIDWLMLDHPRVPGNKVTSRFLQNQGINVQAEDIPKINFSRRKKRIFIDKLKQIRDSLDMTKTLGHFYALDLEVYDAVNQNTAFGEIDNWPWEKVSWLSKLPHHKSQEDQ